MLRKYEHTNLCLAIAISLWLLLIAIAFARLGKFESAAGLSGHPPSYWRDSRSAGGPVRPTLIMLVHPQCPCSRASLYELNRLVALCPDRASISVLFLKPAGYPQSWVSTDLWRQAAAIPGVTVRSDSNGEMASHFCAATSGDTLLFAPNGQLLYEGGITGARGHEGENAGLSSLAALLLGTSKKAAREPVYGCPMTADRRSGKSGGPAWLP